MQVVIVFLFVFVGISFTIICILFVLFNLPLDYFTPQDTQERLI
ncbi:MAG: hypothetical protein WCD37_08435 [Chloroflexia bacterium]